MPEWTEQDREILEDAVAHFSDYLMADDELYKKHWDELVTAYEKLDQLFSEEIDRGL